MAMMGGVRQDRKMKDKTICYRIGVKESTIVKAIQEGAHTLKAIQKATKACTGNQCKKLNPKGRCCSSDINLLIKVFVKQETARPIISEIEQLFMRDFGEFEEDKESLDVAIRIATEFYVYLQSQKQRHYPSYEDFDTSYVVGTLRSGFDFFFDMSQLNHILVDSIDRQLSPDDMRTFGVFKRRYMKTFESLRKKDISFQMRLANLVSLGKMHFIFVGLALM
jgi:bacterioferritin-associated ferredoxin